jgi:hypothetical protein
MIITKFIKKYCLNSHNNKSNTYLLYLKVLNKFYIIHYVHNIKKLSLIENHRFSYLAPNFFKGKIF